MALFKGPDAYVSPLWYEHPCEQVPTWNYVVAHAMGHGKILSKTETLVLLDDLCSRFEGPTGFRPNWLDPLLLKDLVNEIVAFDIVVDYLQAKFKLSQNRSAADRNRVAQGLTERNDGTDLAIVEWMRRVPG